VNIVDSSGWLEYFADDKNADFFAGPIEETTALIVPTISIYEVYKKVVQQRNGSVALEVIATMEQGKVIDLDTNIALFAADLSLKHKIPMADSIILATARAYEATLWTQDADFKHIPEIRYIEKK
jgi:predicted nucleic acid-binding protein